MAAVKKPRAGEKKAKAGDRRAKRVAIIASKGSLDMAYPPLIVATTAASMGWEVGVFFTFFGLDIVNKKKYRNLKVAPLGNPAMPVSVPNIIGAIPGMTGIATWMMRRMMRKQNMPTIPELLDMGQKLGVRLFGCSTTMGVMAVADEDLLEGTECAGAAAFLEFASGADVTLFV
jgi:peroxiredoxin family protein